MGQTTLRMANDAIPVPGNGEKPKVMLLGKVEHAHEAFAELLTVAKIITSKATTRQEFITELHSGIFNGCIVAYRTWDSTAHTGPINASLIPYLPCSLRFICHNGAGYDSIDVSACTARNIRVSNTPHAVDDSTADLTIFLLLGCLRNLAPGLASCRTGEWRGKGNSLPALGHDPRGRVLGILGMGGIGKGVARRARAFGMKVLYHNRKRVDEETERELGASYVGFEELLKGSDVLSLNLPLNAQTYHLLSAAELSLLKPGSVLINTARGAIVDETALVAALNSGQVTSAGLDVYENEPDVHPGLRAHPRVFLVPHMGTWTVETMKGMEEVALGNVRGVVDGRGLRSLVPEQKGLGNRG